MPKVSERLNLCIHHIVSDLDGTTDLGITGATLAGERDPQADSTVSTELVLPAFAECSLRIEHASYLPDICFAL
jgi:hypothetical protein